MEHRHGLLHRGAITHYSSMLAALLFLASCTGGDLTDTSELADVPMTGAASSADVRGGKGPRQRSELTSLTIAPGSVTLESGATQRFVATAKLKDGTTTSTRVKWSVSGGTINDNGLYTSGPVGVHRVIATTVYSNLADTATVTVPEKGEAGLVSLTISPGNATLSAGGTQRFTVSGKRSDGTTYVPAVSWTATGGSIGSDGVYTAGQTAGAFQVRVSADGKADTADVTVSPSGTPAPEPPSASCARTVNVATMTQLKAAVEQNARPGDCILMADGVYQGSSGGYLRMTASGTADQPIRLIGTRQAILDGGGTSVGGFHVQLNASYWVLEGFTVRNRMQGLQLSGSRGSVVRGLEIYNTGQEALSLWKQSTHNVVENNYIHDTGKRNAEYGEGIYLGMAPSKWSSLNGGRPDQTDYNVVRGNRIGPNVTSELIDAKEGTAWNQILGNTFNAKGQVWNSATHWVDSWVEINGDDYVVADNRGWGGLRIAFQTYRGPNGWGNRTRYERNEIDLSTATQSDRYGIYLSQQPSGVVVKCDNTATGGALSNVSCR